MIAGGGVGLVWRVADDVLAAEFLVEVSVDPVDGFFFGNFKETAAGDFGELFEDFFAVGARLFGAARVAAASAASHSSTTHARASEAAAIAVTFFLVSEKDAVNQGVGALGGFEGFGEGFLAAAVDAVGENDEGFAALLFFH